MEIDQPPSERVRELESFVKKIKDCGMVLLNISMWEDHGADSATDEERATADADGAGASRGREDATAALEALVAKTRAEAPAEIDAWVDRHDAYLAAFIDDCAANGQADSTNAFEAKQERAQWGEVRAGKRAFAGPSLFWVTENRERYQRLFGIEP